MLIILIEHDDNMRTCHDDDSLILYSYWYLYIYIYSIFIYTYRMDIDKDIPIFTYIHRGLTDTYVQYLY